MPPPARLDESSGLRPAMNWFHTWLGVVAGSLLFVIFWTGTIAVFDKEIDRWTMPMTRIAPAPLMPLDNLPKLLAERHPDAAVWSIYLPKERFPVVEAYVENEDHSSDWEYWHPVTGENFGNPGTLGGTGFFYRYHFTLHLNFINIGLILCAFAALVMMALCVSGVIIHKKLITDFFTLRAFSKAQRVSLDAHNLSGILALPFHFIISFSGIVIFGTFYVPAAQSIIFAGNPAELSTGYYSREASGTPGGELASLVPMFEHATDYWNGDKPKSIRIHHPGDANAYVELQRSPESSLAYRFDAIWFDGASGELLMATENTVSTEIYHTISGLHMVQFRHLLLRWLYFIAGLAGCVLIATGYVFWVESRRKKYTKLSMGGMRIVQGLAIGSVTGVLIASLGFMIANRLLPLGTPERSAIEVWVFHLVWVLAILHAFIRPGTAWREQFIVIAAGCILAVILNGVTTGDWIPVALLRGDTAVSSIDIFMLFGAAICVASARKLKRRNSIRGVPIKTAQVEAG
jgi:uncharacterized iron-regulated membrane protein